MVCLFFVLGVGASDLEEPFNEGFYRDTRFHFYLAGERFVKQATEVEVCQWAYHSRRSRYSKGRGGGGLSFGSPL